jgi:hypothetical protein
MKTPQVQLLSELLSIEEDRRSYPINERIYSDPEGSFMIKVAQHHELFDANTSQIIQEMFLQRNMPLDAIYSFGYILWRSAGGSIVVEEAAIDCYNFILERVTPTRNWFLWSQTMLLLAESYEARSLGNPPVNAALSKDCLQQAINCRIRLNEKEYRQFNFKFLFWTVILAICSWCATKLSFLWHESVQEKNNPIVVGAIFYLLICAFPLAATVYNLHKLFAERPRWGLIHEKLKLERIILQISPSDLRHMFWAISNPYFIRF